MQQKIIEIVRENHTISCEQIESILNVNKETLLSDLSLLTVNGLINSNPKFGYFYTEVSNRSYELRNVASKEIGDLMSIPTILDESSSIYSAIVTMFVKDVGSLFITKNNFLTGVVSRKDLLKITISGGDLTALPISMVMTKVPNVIYLKPDDTVEDAIRKLVIYDVDSLPVVHTETNEKELIVIGRFSKTSIVRLFMEVL